MDKNIYITIKDETGKFYPKYYIENIETHPFQKHPDLEPGESFTKVVITELE